MGGDWAETAEFYPGLELVTADGRRAVVVSAAHTGRTAPTYNFEVEGFHTYFVGENGVWVHNACSRLLAAALTRAGIVRPAGTAAHHIVAGNARGAAAARATLSKFGIGIDSAANGAFLPTAQHAALHTNAYYSAVNAALSGVTSRTQVATVLQGIGRALLSGGFP